MCGSSSVFGSVWSFGGGSVSETSSPAPRSVSRQRVDERGFDVLGTASTADGLLMAWRPGTEGGDGVADVLYGKVNPSGVLPVTWPKRATDQPNDYSDQTLPTTYNGTGPVYDPAYPFGFGLSYTSFSSQVTHVGSGRSGLGVQVSVRNTGDRAGAVVVPVYVSQPVSPVLVPAKRLVGFTRVDLDAGASKTVTVSVPRSRLAVVPGDVDGSGPMQVEHGKYVFTTGPVNGKVTASGSNSVTM
jgi:beta-glucosidase